MPARPSSNLRHFPLSTPASGRKFAAPEHRVPNLRHFPLRGTGFWRMFGSAAPASRGEV